MKYFSSVLLITGLSLVIFLTNCSGEEKQTEEVVSDGLMKISLEQFQSAGMELGNSIQYNFEDVVLTNGMIAAAPQSKAQVYSFVNGVIRSIAVNMGSYVKKGQLLYTIESKEFIEIQQRYIESVARQKSVSVDYKRIQSLHKDNIASQKELLAIESEYLVLEAQLKALDAELKILHIDPEQLKSGDLLMFLSVISPINGYVSNQYCNIGQYVNSEKMLCRITDNSNLRLEFHVYEKEISKLKTNQKISIRNPYHDSVIVASVETISNSIDPQTRSIQCIARIDGKIPKQFVDGMFVQVEIIVDSKMALAVPSEAIVKKGEVSLIYMKVKEENGYMFFKPEEVITGISSGGFTQLLNENEFKDILVKGSFYF
jgi:cobalt-zinc-cadmium efflux system membrane fusion protein